MAFWGSLAGTLSTMLRLRYPALIDLALSSSAPLLGYPGLADSEAWRKQVTMNWESLSPGCSSLVRRGFAGLAIASPAQVRTAFNTCEEPAPQWNAVAQSKAWGMLEGMAEFVYPSSTSEIPAACARMKVAADAVAAATSNTTAAAATAAGGNINPAGIFAALVNTPASSCFNLTAYNASLYSQGARAWDYLACTEIVHPIGCNNVSDFFPPSPWSLASTTRYCMSRWGGVVPRPTHIPASFSFDHLGALARQASRIMWAY
eukprot:UC1_evm1s737